MPHPVLQQEMLNKLNSGPLQTITGTVERQSAHFYRVTVTEADLRAGVIITCTSAGNDKFKVRGHISVAKTLCLGFENEY